MAYHRDKMTNTISARIIRIYSVVNRLVYGVLFFVHVILPVLLLFFNPLMIFSVVGFAHQSLVKVRNGTIINYDRTISLTSTYDKCVSIESQFNNSSDDKCLADNEKRDFGMVIVLFCFRQRYNISLLQWPLNVI